MPTAKSVITASMGLFGTGGERPSRERMEALATRLAELGFEVLYTGRFAVAFRADTVRMVEQFTSAVLASRVCLSCEHFTDPALRAMGATLEIAPPAILLNEGSGAMSC